MNQVVQTITAQYVRRDGDWTVTVSGLGKTLNGEASGLIAARDRADQLVEQLVPEGTQPTVVHLLNGSAYEFTSAYMTARLSRTTEDRTETAEDTESAENTDQENTAASEAQADEARQDEGEGQEDQGNTTSAAAPTVPRKELSHSPAEAAHHSYAHAG
ncbi:hypothetical protein [Saccharomonospora sp.]|uniref:hypothetical protein n=1 Tax=Saccharomonospora sp. TaxID=33913 RepID=UPI001BB2C802|nr:hypothetical protein [Saccharomonospora sp.]